MPPSALSQVVEAGPQCGETSAELPYAFRILRPAHVPIISARLTGVNRRAIWDDIINLNMRSAFLCSKAVLPGMLERHWGRIINVSSEVGRMPMVFTAAHYAAGKAGMLGFLQGIWPRKWPVTVLRSTRRARVRPFRIVSAASTTHRRGSKS